MTTYPLPSRVRRLAPGSRTHTLAWLSLRTLWHELYDPCPALRQHLGESADDRFDGFIEAAVASGHRMDWTLHLELASYCEIESARLLEEICVAAVRRWVRMDCTDLAWVALRSAQLSGRIFVGLRASSLDQGPRVLLGSLADQAQPRHAFAYQTGTASFHGPGPWTHAYRPYLSTARHPAQVLTSPGALAGIPDQNGGLA